MKSYLLLIPHRMRAWNRWTRVPWRRFGRGASRPHSHAEHGNEKIEAHGDGLSSPGGILESPQNEINGRRRHHYGVNPFRNLRIEKRLKGIPLDVIEAYWEKLNGERIYGKKVFLHDA